MAALRRPRVRKRAARTGDSAARSTSPAGDVPTKTPRGWAYDPEAPDSPVSLSVTVADEEIATATADIFREDLRAAGKGNGSHGFIVNFDRRLPLDVPDRISVAARGASGAATQLSTAANCVETALQAVPPENRDQTSPICG